MFSEPYKESTSIIKRRSNREKSRQILLSKGIGFDEKNHGAHLIVNGNIDFWPGTGKWRDRTGGNGRGVFNLIKHIKNKRMYT